jgi:hypothetical protein
MRDVPDEAGMLYCARNEPVACLRGRECRPSTCSMNYLNLCSQEATLYCVFLYQRLRTDEPRIRCCAPYDAGLTLVSKPFATLTFSKKAYHILRLAQSDSEYILFYFLKKNPFVTMKSLFSENRMRPKDRVIWRTTVSGVRRSRRSGCGTIPARNERYHTCEEGNVGEGALYD